MNSAKIHLRPSKWPNCEFILIIYSLRISKLTNFCDFQCIILLTDILKYLIIEKLSPKISYYRKFVVYVELLHIPSLSRTFTFLPMSEFISQISESHPSIPECPDANTYFWTPSPTPTGCVFSPPESFSRCFAISATYQLAWR